MMINILFTEFPIIGPHRFLSLVMDWIFIFLSFELGLLFLIKYKKQPKPLKNSQDLGFFALFSGFSLMRFFFLLGDYYSSDLIISPFFLWTIGSFRSLLLNFGFLSIMLSTLFFTLFMEKYKKFLFKRFFFTTCFLIQLLIFIVIFFINLEIINVLSFLSFPLFILFFIIYVIDFGKKSKKQNILPKGALKMTLTILLILVGYILSMDLLLENLNLLVRFIGILLQLIAIGFIFIFFRKIPSFFEYDWQDKIESIYILNKNGICLYNYSFMENTEILEKQFISGALASMNIMLNELIHGKPNEISVIKKKRKIVNVFSANYITGILISKEELKYFTYNLKRLVLKVEEIYNNILINWNGDLTVFYPVKNIIDEIFST